MEYSKDPVGVAEKVREYKEEEKSNKEIAEILGIKMKSSETIVSRLQKIFQFDESIIEVIKTSGVTYQQLDRWFLRKPTLGEISIDEFYEVSGLAPIVNLEKEKVIPIDRNLRVGMASAVQVQPDTSKNEHLISVEKEKKAEEHLISVEKQESDVQGESPLNQSVQPIQEEEEKVSRQENGEAESLAREPVQPVQSKENQREKQKKYRSIQNPVQKRKRFGFEFRMWFIKVVSLTSVCGLFTSLLVYTSMGVYSTETETFDWVGLGRAIAIDSGPLFLLFFPTRRWGTVFKLVAVAAVFALAIFTFKSDWETKIANIESNSFETNPEYLRKKKDLARLEKSHEDLADKYITRKSTIAKSIESIGERLSEIEKASVNSVTAMAGKNKATTVFVLQIALLVLSVFLGHQLVHLLRNEEYWHDLLVWSNHD